MKPYLTKTPNLIQKHFSNYTWSLSAEKKVIYLTFDDGPHPEITPWVLRLLEKYKAKATFFCVGDNIKKYPAVFEQILHQNHRIGNHTFNHLNGWKTKNNIYFDNIERTEEIFRAKSEIIRKFKSQISNPKFQTIKAKTLNSKLFRPPYGKIKPSQAKALLQQDYQIIMWDVLSGDFDQNTSKEQCLKNTIKHIQNGSIVVFHDSEKAFKNLEYVLPEFLEYFSEKGFEFYGL